MREVSREMERLLEGFLASEAVIQAPWTPAWSSCPAWRIQRHTSLQWDDIMGPRVCLVL
jgi:hypothetical protein